MALSKPVPDASSVESYQETRKPAAEAARRQPGAALARDLDDAGLSLPDVDEDEADEMRGGRVSLSDVGRIGALLLALTLGAASVQAGERTTSFALFCGAKAADLASTEYALGRGAVESNPLMKDRGVRIGAGVASCAVAAEVDHRLRKHRKSRWALRIVGVGLMGYAAQRNARNGAR